MRDKPSARSTDPIYTYVLTASADYLQAAIDEVRRLDPRLHQIMEPSSEIAVVESALDPRGLFEGIQQHEPVFLRHLAPAQSRVLLSEDGSQQLTDLAREAMMLPGILELTPTDTFSVQARVIASPGKERPYSPYALKSVIAPLITARTGAQEDVRSPQVVLSILALPTVGFIGLSPVQFNLSDWSGGARRFAREQDQLSRSEFKLLEALEIYGEPLQAGKQALDLGAAPGGWTRILRDAGLKVTSVDPGDLDESLQNDPNVEVVKGHAQEWLVKAREAKRKFDVIVNDMRMDARDAARFMVEVSPLLTVQGFALLTLKLPTPGTPGMDPVAILHQALDELRTRYRTVRARQLFHNRSEVTVYLRV